MDPYEILGIPPGASDAEIKKAYRNASSNFTPTEIAARKRHIASS